MKTKNQLMLTEQEMSPAKTLAHIQSVVKAPKSNFNSFGKYKYRSAEDIMNAVKSIINPMGYWLIVSDEVVLMGNRYYIKSSAILTDGNNLYKADGWAREEEVKKGMDASQITGSATSYARKMALTGLFCLDDSKDSDATNKHEDDELTLLHNDYLAVLNPLIAVDYDKYIKYHPDNWKSERSLDNYKKAIAEIKKITL